VEHLIGEEDSSYSFHDDELLTTDVSYPVITSQDTIMLWQAKRFTKKAAERALQYSNKKVDPFDFLQRLLIKFGVFVPIDLSVEKAYLGGRDYSISDLSGRREEIVINSVQSPKYFFLPSLLGPGEPSDIWTYKTSDSWKVVVAHSILFPDGVPPGLMERITAYVLSDMYTNTRSVSSAKAFKVDLLPEADGKSRIKEMLCWRSAFYLKMGKEVVEKSSGDVQESVVEIFATLVDERSQLCVSTDTMGAGMRRLIFSAKGPAGDFGSNIYTGGYARVIKRAVKHVTNEYSGVEFERQAVCPQCLAKKPCALASVWDHSFMESAHKRGEQIVRCRYGHVSDIRLVCGTSDARSRDMHSSDAQTGGETDAPVADLLKAVVIVGLWNERALRIVRAGSGVIVDRKRGLIVTAGHTLMDKNTWREINGKIVIGVIPQTSDSDEPTAVFRYFARIIARDPSIDENGSCRVDACVLQITTRMESDVLDGGRDIGEKPEILLMNNPDAMKRENLPQLEVAHRFELDEAVRILGFNQGGEGLIEPGEGLNRRADFARGYVVMRFSREEASESSLMNRNFLPNEEIVVICPTIDGHSGGPCINSSGEVIGILSRADPADPQRCYLVPSTEFKKLVKLSKRRLKSMISEGVPVL
jgi:S1-C subfamily serine protease